MRFEKTKIYGVDGVTGGAMQLTRTDDAKNLGYSTLLSNGHLIVNSAFDTCYPWSDMCEVTDDKGNVFIKIPKFYSKITVNKNGSYKYQISGCRYDGFSTLFIDGKGNELDYVLVGKYEACLKTGDSSIYSCSSNNVNTQSVVFKPFRASIVTIRDDCRALGSGYQQYDFLIDAIIKQLFIIEFGTTESQSVLKGYVNTDATFNLPTNHADYSYGVQTGETDQLVTTSGQRRVGQKASSNMYTCVYRGIENLWGNVATWCDGIYFIKEKIYLCTDPLAYNSPIDNEEILPSYTYVGNRPMPSEDKDEIRGYLGTFKLFQKNPLLSFPNRIITPEDSGWQDYTEVYRASNSVNMTGCSELICGGNFTDTNAGLWFYCDTYTALAEGEQPFTNPHTGAPVAIDSIVAGGRICYKPI